MKCSPRIAPAVVRAALTVCATVALCAFSGPSPAQSAGGPRHDFRINNGLVKDEASGKGESSGSRSAPATNPLARHPVLMTADVTDLKGRRHHLSFHRIRFTDQDLPVLNIYDRDSGCVIGARDFPRGADLQDFQLFMSTAILKGASSACDHQASLDYGRGALAPVFKLDFKRQPNGKYALTVHTTSLLRDRSGADVLARGTARAVSGVALYADPTPSDGLRSLEGIHLVTNSGIFRGAKDGKHLVIVETTDLWDEFRPGERVFSAVLDPEAQTLTLHAYERVGDGSRCPDTLSSEFTKLKLLALGGLPGGGRTWWSGQDVSPPGKTRWCVAQRVRLDTCRKLECVQWSDTLRNEGAPAWLLTFSEQQARALYAGLPKRTRASRGYKYSGRHTEKVVVPGGSRGVHPWGECGLEGCDARRRREEMDNLLIDLWNR